MSIINQSKASRIAGVSRVAILKLSKKSPLPDFFVSKSGKLQIDSEHAEWQAYVLKKQKKTEKTDTLPTKLKKVKKISKKEEKILNTENKKNIDKLKGILPADERGFVDKLSIENPELIKPLLDQGLAQIASREQNKKIEIDEDVQKRIEDDISKIEVSRNLSSDVILEYQELFKAQKLKEEVLIKQLQRKEREKSLIDVEMGNFLFFSFIGQIRTELALIPDKKTPQLESLYKNDQSLKAKQLLKREFSSMLDKIIKDQEKALKGWKKN